MSKSKYMTSFFERFSYGGFFFGQNIAYVVQFQFLTYFYTEEVGLSLVSVTLLLLIARLWDAINDPIMGAIVDKVNFKSGKFLPWLKFTSYAIPLTLVFVFFNIGGTYTTKLLYAYVSYIVFGMIYTVSDAPIFSLSTVMSDDTYERDKLLSSGRLAAALAAISTAVFINIKLSVGWTMTALIYSLVAFIFMVPISYTAKERVKYKRNDNITFKKIFSALLKNKYLMIYYVGYLAVMATNTLQIIALYFAKYNLGDEGFVTVILAVSILPVVLVAPFLPSLIRMFGKRNLTIYSSIIFIIISIIQYVVGYEDFNLFLAISAVRIIFMQVPLLIYGMFTADCIVYGAYKTGEKTDGAAFSIQTFVTKLGSALASTVTLTLLGYFGFIQQGATQTATALSGIWLTLTIIPNIGFVVMIIIMIFFYKLSESDVERYKELIKNV